MSQSPSFLEESTAILVRTPRVLDALLDSLGDGWTGCRERDGAWTPAQIVEHLIHGEREDWVLRARWILEERDGPFPVFDRDAPMRAEDESAASDPQDESSDLSESLARFAGLRQDNLNTLSSWNLQEPDLDRTGQHPALGTVTLRQLISTWVAHDLSHLRQIARTMASRYRDAVGPWNHPDYLSIFQKR